MRLRRLARSPFAYWAAVVALAAFTASTIAGQVDRAGAQVARYGRLRPVVTAARPVEVGAVLRSADVVVRSLPAAFLPEGALGTTGEVVGRTVVVPLFRGTPVVAGQLAPDGHRGGRRPRSPPAGGRWPCPRGRRRWRCAGATGSTCWPPSTRRRRARTPRSPWPKPPWWSTPGRRR